MSPQIVILLSSVLVLAAVALGILRLGPAWDGIAARQVADLTPRLNELRMDATRLPRYLRWWGLSLVGSFLLFAVVLRMFPLAIAAVYLVYVAPRLVLEFLIHRRRRLLRDQMVGASVGLANAVRAGLSLGQGIESIANEIEEPLASELRRITFEWQHGRSLAEAINEVKQRMKLDSFTLFAHAVGACLERGGKVTDALERISRSLLENQRLERKMDSETASGRKVVVILAAFPFVFLAGFAAMDAETTQLLFNTLIGQLILTGVLVIVYVSARWSQRIFRLTV